MAEPPASPLIERIAAALAELLEAVTVANGYHITVTEVIRPTRVAADYADGTVELYQGLIAAAAEEDRPEGFLAWDAEFVVNAFCIPSDFATEPIDTQRNLVAADLLTAIMADPTLGGLAYPGCRPTGIDEYLTAAGAFAGVALTLSVGFRHPETDPYSSGG